MRVGFVGAGRMGRPMVDRLRAAGHEVAVHTRPADPAEVAREAAAVIVCVRTETQVAAVGEALSPALSAGAVLVVHTTTGPDVVARLADRGVRVVDAPVSGGPHDIAAGRLTLFVGGAQADVAHVAPVLAAYADPVLHLGGPGTGQRVKLVNNALFAAHLGLLADAVRLGRGLGLDEATLLAALPHGSGASRVLTGVTARGSVAGFAGATREFVAEDAAVVRRTAAALSADLGVLDAAIGVQTYGED